MMRLPLILTLLATSALLSACGQQGPLYFPDETPEQSETVVPEIPVDAQESDKPL